MSKKKLPWRCKDEKQAKDKNRIYNSKRWKELRVLKLQSTDGLCEVCMKDGIVTATNIVHHKHPIEESHSFQEMEHWAYMWENLLVVCQRHHAEAHRRIGSQTKEVVKQRAKQRQDRWVEQMKDKFIKKDNQGTMQENKRLGIFGTLNYDKLKDMTMDERKLAVTNHAKDILTRKTKDRGPQIPEDDRNPYDITAEYTIMDYRYNKQGKILATFKAQRTDEDLTIELTSFESVTT